MRIIIDNKLYFKPINLLSSKPTKLNKLRENLFNLISKVWPWTLTFIMFYGLAVLGLRCF